MSNTLRNPSGHLNQHAHVIVWWAWLTVHGYIRCIQRWLAYLCFHGGWIPFSHNRSISRVSGSSPLKATWIGCVHPATAVDLNRIWVEARPFDPLLGSPCFLTWCPKWLLLRYFWVLKLYDMCGKLFLVRLDDFLVFVFPGYTGRSTGTGTVLRCG